MRVATEVEARSWQTKLPFFYGWLIAGVACTGTFMQATYAFALGILSVSMADDLGWSRSAIFLPYSVRGLMVVFVAPAVGHLIDRPNGARMLTVAGGVVATTSLALTSQVQEQWQFFIAFGVLGGLSSIGHPLVAATPVIAKWFLRRRGRAMAFATAGPGFAALSMPLLIALLDREAGWRETWLVLAVITFTLTVLPGMLLRRQAEDLGMTLDGLDRVSGGDAPSLVQTEHSFTAREAFRTKAAWYLLAAHSLAFVSILVLPLVFVPFFVERGFSKAEAASALVGYGLAAVLARAGWGYLVDRVGVRRAAMLLAVYSAVAIGLMLPDMRHLGAVVVVGVLVGYGSGGIMVVNLLLWPTYFGRAHLGAINGLVTPVTSAASSAAPFAVALIFDASGSYSGGIALLVASWLAALVPLYLARTKPVADGGTPPPAPSPLTGRGSQSDRLP